MRYPLLACLLLGSTLLPAQETSSQPPRAGDAQQSKKPGDDDQAGLPASAAKVGPEMAVITVKGLCAAGSAANQQSCVTQISRADFEKLAEAILAGQAQAKILQLAKAYPDLLAYSRAAESRGLDKDERVQQRLAFARLQVLSQELLRRIDQDTAKVPQNEIEEYYKSHAARYETAMLDRVYVPLRKNQQAGSEAEMTKAAQELRTKAAAGSDFFSLQKEAYSTAGMTDVPPNPSVGQVRRKDLPPTHEAAFDLKPGEVSQVFTDTTGHYIYKIENKQVQPIEKAEDDIRRILRRERREKAVQAIQQGVTATLNPEYFGATESPADTSAPKPN